MRETYIRTIIGIPVVLFIPGYVLIATLFPRNNDLGAAERIALSFGLSIAIVPLLGLLLSFTFGIRLITILITLCIYTIILLFVAEYRRRTLPEDERFEIKFHNIYDPIYNYLNSPKNKLDKFLTIVLIFSVIIAAGMIYYVITMPKIGEKFTEFYILNGTGKDGNYQTNIKLGENTTYLVGISNHEYGIVNYKLQTVIDGKVSTPKDIALNHNQKWEKNVSITLNKKGTNIKLEFWLFKENNLTEPYRKLHLWVNSI